MKKYLKSLNQQKRTLVLLTFLSLAVYLVHPMRCADVHVPSPLDQTALMEETERMGSGAAEVFIAEFLKDVVSTFFMR